MLRIKADQNIYRLKDFLPSGIELTLFDPDQGFPSVDDTDILLVRSVTKVNALTLKNSFQLKLVGTASSGRDHLDEDYLHSQGIQILDAKGSNAQAVAEYVMTSLLLWSIEKEVELSDLTIGIIGVGATGTALTKLLENFGLKTVCYDPPKQLITKGFVSAKLSDVLNCDVLSFHLPLNLNSEYPTHHWLNGQKMDNHHFKLIINAARGGIIDEQALLKAMDAGIVEDVILDVWENEPDFNPELAERAFIATPHIAGSSEQSKLNATRQLVEGISHQFKISHSVNDDLYTAKKMRFAELNYSLCELLLRLNPLREYDADLRNIAYRPDKPALFRKLRVDRPYRYEYPFIQINPKLLYKFETLSRLGIKPL